MDHQETIWISKEETDGVPDEPGSTFLEDPLKPEQSDLPIKSDPELKVCAGSSEDRFAHDPLRTSWVTDFIKEEPSLNLEPDEIGNIRCSVAAMEEQETSISIKEEGIVEECNEPDSEEESDGLIIMVCGSRRAEDYLRITLGLLVNSVAPVAAD